MAPEAEPQVETTATDETSNEQEQQATSETEGQATAEDQSKPEDKKTEDQAKPDPRLKTLRADLNKKQQELGTVASERDALKTEVEKLRPVQETLDAVQSRYDRLEEFLTAVGGPLSKALDSKSFTHQLFESDKDVTTIVRDFLRANPTATSEALGHKAAEPGKGKVDPNELLRIASGR